MEHILVPIDFTEISDAASDMAIGLASQLNCEIIYLHLLEAKAHEIHKTKTRNEFHRDVLKEVSSKTRNMENYAEKAILNQVRAEHVLNYDREYNSLIDFAHKNHVRLIVMGTHGISGTREFLVGSHSQTVVKLSHIPVLVVKAGYSGKQIRKMVFLSDFRESPGGGFHEAMSIAEELGWEVHLVFINTPGQFTRHRDLHRFMDEYYSGYEHLITTRELYNAFSLEEGVDEYCEQYNMNIVCIVTHYIEGTSSFFRSSITEKLVNHLKFPILTLHD